MPVFVDNAGPFGGVAGVTKTIPGGSLRHVDQNIETAYAHFYGLSLQKQIGNALTGSIDYTGSSGRKLYDLADPNKPGAALVYTGTGSAHGAAESALHRVQHPRQPRPVAVSRRDLRPRPPPAGRLPACRCPRSTR